MTAFAYYRLPYLHHANFVTQHQGEPEVLSSVAELNGKEGFVIAPFSPSGNCPVLLIHPDESRLLAISDAAIPDAKVGSSAKVISEAGTTSAVRTASGSELELEETSPARDIYAEDFECFHRELEKGTFRKIVLARTATLRTAHKDFENLFMKACRMYPRLFVALVYTPQSGMWLMATPEILLRGEQGKMQTMSLAGILWDAADGRRRIERINHVAQSAFITKMETDVGAEMIEICRHCGIRPLQLIIIRESLDAIFDIIRNILLFLAVLLRPLHALYRIIGDST